MKRICHIRCNKEYWKQFNVFAHWESMKSFPVYIQFHKHWNTLLNIPHMEFRKLIRDLVLVQIKKVNYFDLILEDNESCYEYFKNNSPEVILFQQDDDDIFISPFSKVITPGLTFFNYSWIDPICMRRHRQYRGHKNHVYKRYIKSGKIKSVQSNHTIINNKDNIINFNKINISNLDHSQIDKIGNNLRILSRENHKKYINFSNSSHTLQFYHLCSHSGWKKYVRDKHNTQQLTETQFIDIVRTYIKELNDINIANIPLLAEFKSLYKELL